jgi:hypothetical protein
MPTSAYDVARMSDCAKPREFGERRSRAASTPIPSDVGDPPEDVGRDVGRPASLITSI